MIYQELITATVAGRGDFLGHQPISEANIVLEFLLRQLRSIQAMGYSAKPCPIPSLPYVGGFSPVLLPAPVA